VDGVPRQAVTLSERLLIRLRRSCDSVGRVKVPRPSSLAVVAAGTLLLAVHALRFTGPCDDAYIALRHAANLAWHGQPVYNLGERVEGTSSPAWTVVLAVLLRAGASAERASTLAGLAAGALLVAATFHLCMRARPGGLGAAATTVTLVALGAPVAAWTLGGLETALAAAAVTFAVTQALAFTEEQTDARAGAAGLAVALAFLVRHECALVAVVLLPALRLRPPRSALVRLAAFAAGPALALVALRYAYYGELVPNSVIAKTAAPFASRAAHGARYLRACVDQVGLLTALALFVGPFAVPAIPVVRVARLLLPAWAAMVVAVGGDFLDLHRFFVPVWPLAVAADVLGVCAWLAPMRTPRLAAIAAAAIAVHAGLQARVGAEALATTDAARARAGIEPLGWTRRQATRWAETGRWLRGVARPGDTLATGAAGALPYHAELPTVDLLGLCDAYVAREGSALGVRPGHYREASVEYVLRRAPTFLFIGEGIDDVDTLPTQGRGWEQRGYVWVRVTLGGFDHAFLVRSDRVEDVLARPGVRRATTS